MRLAGQAGVIVVSGSMAAGRAVTESGLETIVFFVNMLDKAFRGEL